MKLFSFMDTTDSGVTSSESFHALGVRVDAVQIPDVIAHMESWIHDHGRCHNITVTGMHGVTEAQHDPTLKAVLNAADLNVPDGMPLVWLARWRGFPLKRRVYGPELMMTFLEETLSKEYRHFLFGGSPGVADTLADKLRERMPSVHIAGTLSPPFRKVKPEEDEKIIASINATNPDVVWVGLSAPKQDHWMHEHRNRLTAPVVVGVGAAFDFHAGIKRQAPAWMQENGFEWLFRLLQEPKRLWRRYLVYGSQFFFYVFMELTGLRKFD